MLLPQNKMTRPTLLLVAFLFSGPASLDAQAPTNLDLLEWRRGVFLERPSFEPYSGPVVSMWDGENIRERGALVQGRWDGVREIFYADGQLAVQEEYNRGELHGPFESYFRQGSPSDKGTYVNGKLDGPYEAYWIRQLAERGSWSEGRECGEWVRYFPSSSYGLRVESTVAYPACPLRDD